MEHVMVVVPRQRGMPAVAVAQPDSGRVWWRGRSARRRVSADGPTIWHRQQIARQRAEMRVFQAGMARMVR